MGGKAPAHARALPAGVKATSLVHAQREYRCPEGNFVFAKGKKYRSSRRLEYRHPRAAQLQRRSRWGFSSAAARQSELRLGVSTLRVMASRVAEISSAAQRDTEPAARVGAGVAEAPSGCQPVARRAARQRGTPGITQQAPEPPEWGGRNSGFAIESSLRQKTLFYNHQTWRRRQTTN